MIEIMSISKLRGRETEFDEIWAIVRSLKRPIRNVTQHPELSPSPQLFRRYLSLRDAGNWNTETFQREYVPTFIAQLASDNKARASLNDLYAMDRRGKKIALLCFDYEADELDMLNFYAQSFSFFSN